MTFITGGCQSKGGLTLNKKLSYKYFPMYKKNRALLPVLLLTAGFLFSGISKHSNVSFREIPHNTLEGDQITPVLAFDQVDRFAAAWVSVPQDEGFPGVFVRFFNINGDPLGPEFQANTFRNPVEYPSAAGCPSGFVITWVSFWKENQTSGAVTARRFDSWGNPQGDEFLVNEYIMNYQGNPAVDMDPQGRFVIAWQSWEQDGDGYGVYAKIFNSSGEPVSSEIPVNTTVSGNQDQPAVAAAEDGSFIIIWRSSPAEGEQSGIFGQRFDRSGNRLGQEFQLNFTTFGKAESPDIDTDSSGNFMVCWHHYRFGLQGYDIYARIFDSTGKLKSPEILVNSTTSGIQLFPSLSCTSEGQFMINWLNRPDEEQFRICSRIFDPNGQPLSDEFTVSGSQNRLRESPDAVFISLKHNLHIWQEYDPQYSNWNLYLEIMIQGKPGFRENPEARWKKKNANKNPGRISISRTGRSSGR